jgi:phosphoenolpyruvate carboxylase
MERRIPHTMSSQHPDNASIPSWAKGGVVAGDDEVTEAYQAFAEFGCEEVMWDAEGKDVDSHVVRKLVSSYEQFFREREIGKDVFITYRVPNPAIELAERKVLVETLWSIPQSFDIAKTFYNKESVTPIFEVILPFTTSAEQLTQIVDFYRTYVSGVGSSGKTNSRSDWLGEFEPKTIELIPLVEDFQSMTKLENIIGRYAKHVKPNYVRAFIARSDPALNYGLIPSVLLVKIALSDMQKCSEKLGIPIYPIIGVGSLPFRGHLSPENVENFIEEYEGVTTTTVQSALRYDYPANEVKKTISFLNKNLGKKNPQKLSEEDRQTIQNIIRKFSDAYLYSIETLSPIIERISKYVPSRRARKLHIGLFGYSRKVGSISLPRAIPFTAALYTLGAPPELLGLEAAASLTEDEWDVLKENYLHLKTNLQKAAGYVSWQNINLLLSSDEIAKPLGLEDVKKALPNVMKGLSAAQEHFDVRAGPRSLNERKHENTVNNFLISLAEGNEQEARRYLVEAAQLRRSMG